MEGVQNPKGATWLRKASRGSFLNLVSDACLVNKPEDTSELRTEARGGGYLGCSIYVDWRYEWEYDHCLSVPAGIHNVIIAIKTNSTNRFVLHDRVISPDL